MQAGMVQEELRVLHIHLKANRRRLASRQLRGGSHCPPTQQHTPSNKATLTNSATPWTKHIQSTTEGLGGVALLEEVCHGEGL